MSKGLLWSCFGLFKDDEPQSRLTCSVRKPAVDARQPLRKAPVDGHARW